MKAFVSAALLTPLLAACVNNEPASEGFPAAKNTVSQGAVQAQAAQQPGAESPSDLQALKPVQVDTSKRLEYRDVWVYMGDLNSQRQLAPYLGSVGVTLPGMSSSWVIDRVEILSESLRHYRFRRFVSAEGKGPPELDFLTPKQ